MLAKDLPSISLKEFEAMEKDERCNYELIDGVVMMSPSPSREHQKIGTKLIISIGNALQNTPCEPLYELDIQFNENVYRPDVMVFCDKDAEIPEIVIEILSPSTKRHDLVTKVVKYEEMGIKEYWIVDPKVKTVIVHDFVNEVTETYSREDIIQSEIRAEILIKVAEIFA